MTPGRDLWWADAVAGTPSTTPAVQLESEAPYLLAFTSGTTGKPKGALHVQAAFLLSIAREAAYQADLHAGDRVLFSTDMGWIMGPWTLVGAGALGATVVFMEGAPDWPGRSLLAARRGGARDDARSLADARSRADPEGRAGGSDVVTAVRGDDGRDLEPRALRLARRARLREWPNPDHQHQRRHRGGSLLPLADLDAADKARRGRLSGARPGHGRAGRERRAGAAARSGSSCAAGPGRE